MKRIFLLAALVIGMMATAQSAKIGSTNFTTDGSKVFMSINGHKPITLSSNKDKGFFKTALQNMLNPSLHYSQWTGNNYNIYRRGNDFSFHLTNGDHTTWTTKEMNEIVSYLGRVTLKT